MKTRLLLAVMLATGSLPCIAEITRSVDSQGNVTFSDEPVPGSVESTPVILDTTPAPSTQEINKSEQQAQEMINLISTIGVNNPNTISAEINE